MSEHILTLLAMLAAACAWTWALIELSRVMGG
jgi:hypothetical protein